MDHERRETIAMVLFLAGMAYVSVLMFAIFWVVLVGTGDGID